MDHSNNEICAICHEILNDKLYTLPECSHVFHTNCIMHWFRAQHNTCPLCMHHGINGNSDFNLTFGSRAAALENYKKLRRQSRRKDAPKDLKKAINRIKKIEQRHKKLKEAFKKFKNTIPPPGKTYREIHKEWMKQSRKCWGWSLKNELNQAKIALGANSVIPIIIATKVNLP